MRLSTPVGIRLESAVSLAVTIGGAESNVAVALARLGRPVAWASALPRNALGLRIAHDIAMHGVDVTPVLWSDDTRAGVYFVDTGSTPRPTRVVYDRTDSAIARINPDLIDAALVRSARALHLTGITPALSDAAAACCYKLANAARAAQVPITLDVNYRSRLWTPEAARAGLEPLLASATVLFCGMEDAATIWRITGEPADVARTFLDRSAAQVVVVTAGSRGAVAVSRDAPDAIVYQDASAVEPVDPVGAGDAFAAGFLHRWLDDRDDLAAALRSGVALASLKMTIGGDFAIVTADELDEAIALLGSAVREIDR